MPCLSDAERAAILALARRALIEAICRNQVFRPVPSSGILETRCGVFVSIHLDKKLRGCIGVIQPRENLGESIVRSTIGAALEDPRFPRMQPEEVPAAEIEVSLLSSLEETRPEQIEIGKHGILIEHGLRRGLLLPQVALEHQLTRERFLEETCFKAGLTRDAWKEPGARIFSFTCEIVSEHPRRPEETAPPAQ